MPRSSRLAVTVAAAALAALTATAAMSADIFVIGGKPDDAFWSRVKKGAEDAGLIVEAQGGSVTWLGPQNYDNLGVDAAELIRQAIDQGADAIVGPNWVPEAMDPAFAAVVEADSAALALLLEWSRRLKARGDTLSVTGMPDGLKSLSELYGLDEVLPLAG
ncbi:MAG: hypothetical protein CVT71_01095 [Alphaproteobacteria bacterium HGW-Alphaproteobacteria-10]|nr:MAG: hypothetical protein CVT71_01095 [Alphaproteobacteria bacterium HGW-Alphaproteobacteria-10]